MILYFGTTVSITAMGEEAVSPEKTIKKALIGISRNNDIYHFPLNQRKYTMKGAHSGLLRDEMEIPVIVFPSILYSLYPLWL